MADRPAADVRFGNLLHGNGGLHPRWNVDLLQCVLQSERVHNCCQHTHVVCCCTVDAACAARDPAPDISATAYNGNLNAKFDDFLNLLCDGNNRLGINAISVLS
ncbi:hypothetical protein D3C75_934810 [compost metagenome]